MMGMNKELLAILTCTFMMLCAGTVTAASAAPPVLVLEAQGAKPFRVIEGDATLLDSEQSAASTFKIWLAAIALEKGILDRTTRYNCRDSHLFGGRLRRLGLHEALILSSNAYFRETARRLGLKQLNDELNRLNLTKNPQAGSVRSVNAAIHGDRFRITPRQQFEAIQRLALADLSLSRETWQTLRGALEWPVPDGAHWKVFGKTGCYGGAVWCIGWGESRPHQLLDGATGLPPGAEPKIVTVFASGGLERRPEVMRCFFRRFGIEWHESLLQQLHGGNQANDGPARDETISSAKAVASAAQDTAPGTKP